MFLGKPPSDAQFNELTVLSTNTTNANLVTNNLISKTATIYDAVVLNNLDVTGLLTLEGVNLGGKITLAAPDVVSDPYQLTFPDSAGRTGQVLTLADPGVLTWGSGGSSTSVTSGTFSPTLSTTISGPGTVTSTDLLGTVKYIRIGNIAYLSGTYQVVVSGDCLGLTTNIDIGSGPVVFRTTDFVDQYQASGTANPQVFTSVVGNIMWSYVTSNIGHKEITSSFSTTPNFINSQTIYMNFNCTVECD